MSTLTGPGCGSGIWQKEKNMATYSIPKTPKKKGKKKNPKRKKKG
jgi:hypothetical protein